MEAFGIGELIGSFHCAFDEMGQWQEGVGSKVHGVVWRGHDWGLNESDAGAWRQLVVDGREVPWTYKGCRTSGKWAWMAGLPRTCMGRRRDGCGLMEQSLESLSQRYFHLFAEKESKF